MKKTATKSERECFTFVIPVVHPEGPRVSDYSVVERALALTVASITSQKEADTRVIIVCHRLPDWHDTCPDTVTFLLVGDHPRVSANVKNRYQDKGVKFIAGFWYALLDHQPALFMPMDADDFVRNDIANSFTRIAREHGDKDVFLISRGFHVALQDTPEGFDLLDVFELDRFDETCGTSRIFISRNFRKLLLEKIPGIDRFDMDRVVDAAGVLKNEFLDFLIASSDQDLDNTESFIFKIGDHTWQGRMFNIHRIYETFVAKGCGHGNHVSGKKMALHTRRLANRTDAQKFMNDFGLANTKYLRRSFSLKIRALGLLFVLYDKIRTIF